MTIRAATTFHDPAALMRIRSLDLRARTIIQGIWKGVHRSTSRGFSAEFAEYRHYQPGDDLRYLDWKLYGRSDRYYVRRFEEDTALACYLLVDRSRSMDYGSLSYTKAEYARTLAATFSIFLREQGDSTGLMTFSDQVHDYLPASSRPSHLHSIILALQRGGAGGSTDLTQPLERIERLIRRRSLIIVLSDLLVPAGQLARRLSLLAAGGHDVVLFQLLDPAEINFNFDESTVFRDLESGRDFPFDPASMRRGYLEKFAAHQAEVGTLCRRLGISHHLFPTDRPLEHALFDYLRDRRSHRSVQRHSRKENR